MYFEIEENIEINNMELHPVKEEIRIVLGAYSIK